MVLQRNVLLKAAIGGKSSKGSSSDNIIRGGSRNNIKKR